jgi:hypothetical protein
MSINLGQFVFLLLFNFLSAERFFSNTGLKFNKRFFFDYCKYFKMLPVTEGHLTPPSPEGFENTIDR